MTSESVGTYRRIILFKLANFTISPFRSLFPMNLTTMTWIASGRVTWWTLRRDVALDNIHNYMTKAPKLLSKKHPSIDELRNPRGWTVVIEFGHLQRTQVLEVGVKLIRYGASQRRGGKIPTRSSPQDHKKHQVDQKKGLLQNMLSRFLEPI